MPELSDRFGRKHTYLRISVTELSVRPALRLPEAITCRG
jgi:hypothetical protein